MTSPHESCLQHAKLEATVNSEHLRIDRHEKQIEEIRDNLMQATACLREVAKVEERMSKMDERLEALEQAPGKRWDTAVTAVLTAVIGALVGMMIGRIGIM